MKTMLATVLLLSVVVRPAGAQDLKADLMQVENKLWAAWGKKDGALTQKSLTEDAVQVIAGIPPITGRDAIAKAITTHACDMRSFTLRDATLRQVTPDVVILSYTAEQNTSCDGKKLPARVHATAIYVRQKGNWLQASYQETPLE